MNRRGIYVSGLILLITSLGLTMPPPSDYYPEACEDSGGNWPGGNFSSVSDWAEGCQCPEGTTLQWGYCFKRTPQEACEKLGGRVTSKEEITGKGPILGSPGANFACVKGTGSELKDITSEAINYSATANEELKEIPEDKGILGGPISMVVAVVGVIVAAMAGYYVGNKRKKES